MSEGQDPANWRGAVHIGVHEESGDPAVVVNENGEDARDAIDRVIEAGTWDIQSEPALAPLLGILREMIEDPAVMNWIQREVLMESEEPEARAVRGAFEAYQTAVVEDDFDAIADLLDDHTRNRFLRYHELAVAGGGALPDSTTPTVDHICVELFRAVFEPKSLADMSEDQVIAFAVHHLFAGPEGFDQFQIGLIEVDGDDAAAELSAGESPLPIKMAFRHEGGEWRVSIACLFPLIEATYAAIARQQGMTTEEFVARYLEAVGTQSNS